MAASSISMLALLLLMPAVTPGLSTEGEGSLDHTATALIALKQIIQTLEYFGDTVQEGLHQQRQSCDALTDLQTLPATVLRVEERINQQDEQFELLREKIEDISKVEAFTQEIVNLKNQFYNKYHMVGDLQRLLDDNTSENERNVAKLDDLREKFEAKSKESEQNLEKAQDLGRNLDESRRYADKLQLLLQQLNNTLESEKKDVPECTEQLQQKITNLVLQYNVSRDWPALKRGLEAAMDQSTEAYRQLKNIPEYGGNAQLGIGKLGYTQLITLLLDAGMPVNMADKDNYTLLVGAAYGGHYELVKMLMSRGADLNVRDVHNSTPLIYAAYHGHLEIVKLLVDAGADTTTTAYGHNALSIARNQGHTAVQRYLEQFPV